MPFNFLDLILDSLPLMEDGCICIRKLNCLNLQKLSKNGRNNFVGNDG